ncbi:MAG: undecaprenyldiphospho-muramoylpentapeptide beta-N-acetylglucosaminyltransferase [Bacteroidales bacterium]|jgi:UDP-N-acetylglucosamine--N-acetylmuramyl-(pentapeptide) pyrophosphoryl-undecaprenol N-acetylglucosamine transferase|nr:undecaprenyldiphospho-muramoylpentapeptide beta-N-acetylglucosaminyltransferase [Bacteroidales bacterium]
MSRIIISGGGTGGHIFPALAIAHYIKKKNPNAEVLFIGANGRMEMKRIPEAGFNIEGLDVFGIRRDISWSGIKSNLKLPFMLISTVRKAKRIMNSFKPDIVIGVGGYASGPALRAAQELKIPTIIQEQNSYPGKTNKWLSKKVAKICVAYDGLEFFFPKQKIVMTGNPVREEIINFKPNLKEAYEFFNLASTKKTVLVIGGSQGSQTINQVVLDFIDDFEKLDCQLIWQTGDFYYKSNEAQLSGLISKKVKIAPFINRMDFAYSAADYIVSRAGALTISELAIVGLPAILIPLPTAAEDHQTANAKQLSDAGAAILLPDIESKKLFTILVNLMSDFETSTRMEKNIRSFAKPDAIMRIVEVISKFVNIKI